MDEWYIVIHKDECQYQSYNGFGNFMVCTESSRDMNDDKCEASKCPLRYVERG